jgi:NADPH:quinone reductase-like Zn-dependent oxidoreductase
MKAQREIMTGPMTSEAVRTAREGMMKAIVHDTYGSADVLELRDIDIPVVGDDDVLVRVHAAGVDPGVWHLLTGLPYLVRLMGYGVRRPKSRVPGLDLAGRVEAVGQNVTQVKPGDEVFGTGAGSFAEYTLAKERKWRPNRRTSPPNRRQPFRSRPSRRSRVSAIKPAYSQGRKC